VPLIRRRSTFGEEYIQKKEKMGERKRAAEDGYGKFNRGGIPTVFYCKLSRLSEGGG
jgi:hypothetical protein